MRKIPPLIAVHRDLPSLVLRQKLACAPVGRSQVSHRPAHHDDEDDDEGDDGADRDND